VYDVTSIVHVRCGLTPVSWFIRINYFERPELHRLHNRSGELWSPLVALATFCEEQGGVTGLREAMRKLCCRH
jgi:hypothetical protein